MLAKSMSGMQPECIRKRLSLAPRDGAQVLARSVHLHPGCHGSPWRVRMFVRRHTAQAIAREEQCPCDGREPCPRHPCFQGLVLQLPAQDGQTQAEGHTQAIRHPSDSPSKRITPCAALWFLKFVVWNLPGPSDCDRRRWAWRWRWLQEDSPGQGAASDCDAGRGAALPLRRAACTWKGGT